MVEKRLTAMQIVRLSAPSVYPDGGGLYLQVTIAKDGTPRKSWIFRFSLHSRARHMGLGSVGVITLAEARAGAISRAQRFGMVSTQSYCGNGSNMLRLKAVSASQ
ncbi:MAG: Arm DNA-binding domain-containing protein [Methylocella sp.]|jgi:hypothetical protein